MMRKSILSAALIVLLSGCETSPPRERTAEPTISEVAPPRPTSDKTIRIAAWNIENLGQSKMKKPAVMQEIAAIVRKYDIVAVCEVSDKKEQAPKELLRVINEGGSPAYDYRLSERTGKQENDKKAQEQYAYFFNTATVKQEGHKGLFPDDAEDLFEREPYLARFKSVEGNFSFVLVVIHTKPDRKITRQEISALHKVNEWAKEKYKDEDDFITLGDFNAGDAYVKLAEWPECLFRTSAYTWVVPDDAKTNFAQSQAHDRIVFQAGTKEDYTGEWSVDKAFTDEAVSDHFPVWAKFRVSKDTNGREPRPTCIPLSPALFWPAYENGSPGQVNFCILNRHGMLPMKRPGQLHGANLPDRIKGQTKPRHCLRFGKKFQSRGSSNRLCRRGSGEKLASQVCRSTTMAKRRRIDQRQTFRSIVQAPYRNE